MNRYYDDCPVCKKLFETCKHGFGDIQRWQDEQRIRAIVRDELKKLNRKTSNTNNYSAAKNCLL